MGGPCSANGWKRISNDAIWTIPGGQQGRGRLNSRWIDGVESGASKLGCRNWRVAVQDSGRWRQFLRRPRSTQGCRAEDADDVGVLLAIQTSYKHRLVRICVIFEAFKSINLLAPELFFFLILAPPVYKKWIIQEPNALKLWNKLHFQEKKTESIYHV